MTIIAFPNTKRQMPSTAPATADRVLPDRFYERKPFAGLPFVSEDTNEYGWPDDPWKVEPSGDNAADCAAGRKYARLAYEACKLVDGI